MSSRGINKAILVGNLGQAPDIRSSAQGSPIANLSIATDESYKDRRTGQLVAKTEWHRVVLFNRLAELAERYLRKGSKIYVEGRIQTRKWQDQQGQDRYTTEIVAIDLQMLGGDGASLDSENSALKLQSSERNVAISPTKFEPSIDVFDDDIPF